VVGNGFLWGAVQRGDPGREDVVGMVGEVIANKRVEQVLVVVEVSGGDGDELTVAGREGGVTRPGEKVGGLVGKECRGHEQPRRSVRRDPVENLGAGRRVAADQPADEALAIIRAGCVRRRCVVVDVIGHGNTVGEHADDALTDT
jgi:hypothetical protein